MQRSRPVPEQQRPRERYAPPRAVALAMAASAGVRTTTSAVAGMPVREFRSWLTYAFSAGNVARAVGGELVDLWPGGVGLRAEPRRRKLGIWRVPT